MNVFCKTKDYANALALVDWALAFYPGLKDPEKQGYMDKSEAFLLALRADVLLSLCKKRRSNQQPSASKGCCIALRRITKLRCFKYPICFL